MTRVNMSFPPRMLADKHLVAEWKELMRMPRFALRYEKPPNDMPREFCLNKGHMKSLLPFMDYLCCRQSALGREIESRGFNANWKLAQDTWTSWMLETPFWQVKETYVENNRDFNIVLERLKERDPEFYKDVEFRENEGEEKKDESEGNN